MVSENLLHWKWQSFEPTLHHENEYHGYQCLFWKKPDPNNNSSLIHHIQSASEKVKLLYNTKSSIVTIIYAQWFDIYLN